MYIYIYIYIYITNNKCTYNKYDKYIQKYIFAKLLLAEDNMFTYLIKIQDNTIQPSKFRCYVRRQ